ncbi:hypothetical protein [Sinomonas sp. G460-2]|uniref:hypothetical protein n=1 Tax=Sinomonas sp. G460-2 TaxID=3393464 RepID=UPI0039EEB6D4
MPTFEITCIYAPSGGTADRNRSIPFRFDARTRAEAKRRATELIGSETVEQRTTNIAIITTSVYGDALEVTRWVRGRGWMDLQ